LWEELSKTHQKSPYKFTGSPKNFLMSFYGSEERGGRKKLRSERRDSERGRLPSNL